jgi:abnormal spindle-like microcephaly-associated protein
MCYNPYWLRIGLYIVLGGDSLLNEEFNFLKEILEKQMFSQTMTGKSSSDKKVVEGHHLLKRIFLFVAALDRAKLEGALPLQAGIDSLDGGSPLLFCHQGQVKTSQQIIKGNVAESICF